jgi:hypothetical protein
MAWRMAGWQEQRAVEGFVWEVNLGNILRSRTRRCSPWATTSGAVICYVHVPQSTPTSTSTACSPWCGSWCSGLPWISWVAGRSLLVGLTAGFHWGSDCTAPVCAFRHCSSRPRLRVSSGFSAPCVSIGPRLFARKCAIISCIQQCDDNLEKS